ncbi:MAG: DUF4184 family protein [Actinomycetota bacterium]
MPLTVLAHQGFVLPAKIAAPRHVDATALCIGAGAPDLAYALGPWLNAESHTVVGLVVWAVPFTLIASLVMRRWAASGIFAVVPDLGPFRLRSYRVLATRRPAALVTLTSAVAGAGSHVVIDGFTHRGRWGADWLGLNEPILTDPIRGEALSGAEIAQDLGHVVGAVIFTITLFVIGVTGRLCDWYGEDAVAEARAVVATARQRAVFGLIVAVPVLTTIGVVGELRSSTIFISMLVGAPAILVAGAVVGRWLDRTVEGRFSDRPLSPLS